MNNVNSLYLKYRPRVLEEMVGNRTLVDSLSVLLANKNSIPHAILLTGASGCGKTTLARIIKGALECSDIDFKEVDSADFRGIDTIRDIRRQMMLKPMSGSCRIWLLDESHKLSGDAQPALLKALEDTPKHVYFILATTDPHKLITTIRNRCMMFSVQSLSERQMVKLLESVINKEGKAGKVSSEVLQLIFRESLGSPRAALVMLQKIIDLDIKQQAMAVEKAASEENQTIDLCKALIGKASWKKVREILKGLQEQEPESIRRAVLGYCNAVMLNDDNAKAWLILDSFRYPTYDIGWPAITMACYEILEKDLK